MSRLLLHPPPDCIARCGEAAGFGATLGGVVCPNRADPVARTSPERCPNPLGSPTDARDEANSLRTFGSARKLCSGCAVRVFFWLLCYVNGSVHRGVWPLNLIRRMLTRLRSRQAAAEASYEELRHIHQRRFAKTDPERFVRLWCEIADICEVSPRSLHENSNLADLCPPFRLLGLVEPSSRNEALEALVMAETRGKAPPARRPTTVGEMLDYMLEPARISRK